MHLNAEFIQHISQILRGRSVRSRQQAESLRALLQTREEFLTWMIVHDNLLQHYPEVASALKEQVARHVHQPSTKRKESNFPLAHRREALEIETATKSLLEAIEDTRSDAEKLIALNKAHQSRIV